MSGLAYPVRALKRGGAITLIVRQGDGLQRRDIITVHSALYVALAMSDASIVVAYVGADANEQNGLFVTRSTDTGGTWSDPIAIARGRGYWPQLTRVGSSLALLWIGEERPFRPQGLHIAVSHDTGASWAASEPIQGGGDATTFAIGALAGQKNTAIVADEAQQPHKAYRVGGLTTTSLTWLSRDSVDAVLPPMMTLGDNGDAVVLWSGVDRTQRRASFTMMRMRVRAGGLSCAQGSITPEVRLATIRQQYPCRDYRWPIGLFADSGFKRNACSLVGLALSEIAAGRAVQLGVLAKDTSDVVAAQVLDAQLNDIRADGTIAKAKEGFWTVYLQMKGRPYSIAVDVNSFTGKIDVRKDHSLPAGHPPS